MRGIFVTGTDTNIGKTVVSAAMMHRYRAQAAICYWKPVQTGCETDSDTETVKQLGACNADEIIAAGARLPRPLSPHLSARLAGVSISIETLLNVPIADDRVVIVEGAGGVLVPLNDKELMIDLMARLALPVVVVARTELGTINHTLLTLSALRERALTIAGVVMSGRANAENRAAIEHYGRVKVLGELPVLEPLTPQSLGEWARRHLDREGVVDKFL